MMEYLKIAQDLEMFGITYFPVFNQKGTEVSLEQDFFNQFHLDYRSLNAGIFGNRCFGHQLLREERQVQSQGQLPLV